MRNTFRSCFAAASALLLFAAGPIAADELANVSTNAYSIQFLAKSQAYGYQLTVAGPAGIVAQKTFIGPDTPTFELDAEAADGTYTWELRAMAAPRDRGTDQPVQIGARAQSGAFAVVGGSIVSGGEEAEPAPAAAPMPGAKAQTFTTDLIVQGSQCIGIDCTSTESFSFDTLRLKENNLRIKFDDTSGSASFPGNDWELTANDSTNGGLNRFSIRDVTAGRDPFTVLAGAPANALYINASGHAGFGTSNPVVDLHAVNGNSPTLRLDQDGSSGFTPQIWDLAGNETNFFVRDVTNGSKLPLRIKPGAPDNSVYISAAGNVGNGTDSPSSPIHIKRTDGSARVTVENTSADDSTLMVLQNAGVARFSIANTTASNWRFTSANNGNLVLNIAGGGINPLTLTSAGDLTVTGTVTPSSDRNVKENFETVDHDAILERLLGLDITSWNYINDDDSVRHLGPMAQDFFASFGLGATDKGISVTDSAGVTFAAIQALHADLEAKNQEVSDVKARNQDLEERVAQLERLIEGIAGATE